jgi:hypothetical protein
MTEERRGAARMALPEGIDARVGGVAVRLINLSAIGALFEHDERFTIPGARIEIAWQEHRASFPIKIVRTAIIRRPTYQTGVQFTSTDPVSEGAIGAILRHGDPAPAAPQKPEEAEDTWTRQVKLEADDTAPRLPYAQYRLTAAGWVKRYVASPEQPDDGFTLARGATDAPMLQRTFERADEETRRELQRGIAESLG